ncbi:MAG: HIT family protein [Gemmatimonadota bacterium]|nr:HIT family protein [Gemmatimonadota bacterium]
MGRDAVIAESRHAVAIRDRYPVGRGHTLVLPVAHVKSLFDLDAEAQADVWRLVARVRDELRSRRNPDGFNIGVNDGRAAGQTVEHAHIHVIPRFDGDVGDPRGGVRWVLPECAAYWDR